MSASPTPAPASPSLDANPLVSDWLVFQDDGRVTLKTGKVEIGQGVLTALVQIAADELDIYRQTVSTSCLAIPAKDRKRPPHRRRSL